jgi:hypothetical protein
MDTALSFARQMNPNAKLRRSSLAWTQKIGTTAATGLPVRLLIRQRSMDGTVQERPWVPIAPNASIAKGLAILIIAAVPYIGGVTTGLLMPGPAIVAAIGLALWLGQMIATSAYKRKRPTLSSLTTAFTFAAAYGLAFVIAGYILHPR